MTPLIHELLHGLYYAIATCVLLGGILWKLGHYSGSIDTKLDTISQDVIEIKTNHLPHLDARVQSIEEYLRK